MKFCDMPYERIDFEKVKEELLELMEAFKSAGSAQKQFLFYLLKVNSLIQLFPEPGRVGADHRGCGI